MLRPFTPSSKPDPNGLKIRIQVRGPGDGDAGASSVSNDEIDLSTYRRGPDGSPFAPPLSGRFGMGRLSRALPPVRSSNEERNQMLFFFNLNRLFFVTVLEMSNISKTYSVETKKGW